MHFAVFCLLVSKTFFELIKFLLKGKKTEIENLIVPTTAKIFLIFEPKSTKSFFLENILFLRNGKIIVFQINEYEFLINF